MSQAISWAKIASLNVDAAGEPRDTAPGAAGRESRLPFTAPPETPAL
jgi:hypothetical protein